MVAILFYPECVPVSSFYLAIPSVWSEQDPGLEMKLLAAFTPGKY